jgi:hypothetical protein
MQFARRRSARPHYLSKENTRAYGLDDSFSEWLRFFNAIGGKRSTMEISRDEMPDLQSIDEIAAQDGILTFAKIPQPT